MQKMELTFQHRHQSEMTRLRTFLVEEGERNKAEALDFLGLRFKQVPIETEKCLHAGVANESEWNEHPKRKATG